MTSALEQLLRLRDADDRYDRPVEDLVPLQLAAANERLETRAARIPLLKNRLDSSGLTKITRSADLVPLLFAHNTYKSYGESWLAAGQWDRMARWLQTVSTYPGHASFAGVDGLDEWIARLETEGRFVACSSGTTGKPAMLGATDADLDFSSRANVSSFAWATGIRPANDRKFFGLGPRTTVTRNERIREAMIAAYGSPTEEPYQLPVPPISVGSTMAMILLRRRITEGTARAAEIAEFERLSGERQANLDAAQADAVAALIKSREHRLLLTGFFPSLYPLAIAVREQGFGTGFHSDNAVLTGGGLKGVSLPPDYREVILETFSVRERHVFHLYSMQELNTPFPRCAAGRYHVAPWVIALPLDEPGEQLLDTTGGEIQARAAFLDLSLDGRWGGIISGDRISIDVRSCACGHQGPTIGPEIVRFSDLASGDKITCAGTIDAYVRGVA
ncbi:hypothetical protein [Pseudofrankia inefficax]|uniref:Acyl-protein synthetase LuxE domain-containing protein n=1 Tax=Pseudofrankia inefficax (strain DSM 45817 / CECT 9037 / DDB 130130 / EuI1c) TaxID=298654 RepID=E3J6A9_PSEI1|nr:hypothetical protein [Pseudofrankia inefficax]ADP79536.1 hypothetical protein FraEuI1c_1473 [Pseudofrankia inefficax]